MTVAANVERCCFMVGLYNRGECLDLWGYTEFLFLHIRFRIQDTRTFFVVVFFFALFSLFPLSILLFPYFLFLIP